MSTVLDTVRDRTLTYSQKLAALARHGEAEINPLVISSKVESLRKAGVICDGYAAASQQELRLLFLRRIN